MRGVLFLLCYTVACAQTHAVTVWGLVKDGSGAVVANAAVVFSNVDQQRDWKTRTESDGEYVLVQVPPGNYGLSVEAPGFRRYQRRGLILEVAQTAAIDVTMELGPVTESLEVTAGTPMLESASSAIGEVINGRAAEDLPLVARNTARLIALTPGIADTFNFRLPGANSGDSNRVSVSVSGGRTLTSEVLLDGSPQATVGYLDPAYIPLPEATMELNVQTNSLPAEYGRSGGGVINIVHRSGSRDFHGVLYEFLGNDKLNANGFFDNRNGRARAPLRLNNFGFAFGGPLTPSRKTTFFYVSAQKVLVAAPMSQTFTLPTVKMKNGDFTETGPVYDPQSIDATGRRQVFAGNLIPAARWNTIGANLLKYYPDPTAPGLANNYYAQSSEYPTNTDLSVRIDRRLSDRQNLFGRFSLEDNSDRVPDFFRNVASPNARTVVPHNRSATADYSIYLHGWVLHGNYGYASTDVINHPTGEGFDITSIGFPSSMQSNAQLAVFPTIVVSGLPTLGPANGDNQASDLKYYHHALTADATRTSGSHTIKLGGSYRNYRAFVFRPNSPSGMFQFSEGFTRETFNGTTGGNAVASLLLGLPFGLSTAGGIGYEPSLTTEAPYVGAYVQDNWRVNSRLVLDMGIRWDSDRPLRELQDQTSWFDFNAALPLTLPGLGTVHGGLVFAGRNGTPRGNQDPDNNNLGPRFGLAFKAAPNLVLRSGFGLMYGITTPYGPNTFNTGALSFNAFTDFVSTIDGGRTPFTTLSNPFPSGYNTPANGRDGLLTLIGQAIGAQVRGDRTPYVTQWHINVQTELFTDALLDVGYAGSAGAKLLAITQLDQLPDQYLSLGDALTLSVANPFFGLVPPTSAIGQPTTTAGQLLRPYPQFTGVTYYWGTFSHSSYHALQAKLRKRYRGGIQMLVAYTWSKSLDDNSGSATGGNQNPGFTDNYRRDLDKSYSAYDIPHRFVTSVDSELPFGAGRQWLNHKGIGNAFYGGWRMGSIVSLQSGPPISVASSINTTGSFGGGQRPDRTGVSSRTPGGVEDRLDNYIAQNAFVNPRRYTFGNAGRFLPENRAPGLANVNLSLTKSVRPIERLRLDFRGELYNLFNHPNFRIPAGSATGVFGLPQFGTITTAESQRQITLAVKLYF